MPTMNQWLKDIATVEKTIRKHGRQVYAKRDIVGLRVNEIVKFSGLPKSQVLKVLHGAIYNLDEQPIFFSRYDPLDERFKLWYKNEH